MTELELQQYLLREYHRRAYGTSEMYIKTLKNPLRKH